MKPRWHFLFLLLSLATALLVAHLLSDPLYEITDTRFVSFVQCRPERKEWSVIVGSQDKKSWWLETRAGRSPEVIRRLPLELPLTQRHNPYQGRSVQNSSDFIVCGEDYIGITYILHTETGKLLRKLTYTNSASGMIALHESKYAFVQDPNLNLLDFKSNTAQLLKVPGVRHLQFSPDGKLLVAIHQNEMTLIDADRGQVLASMHDQKKFVTFRFISNDTLLITFNNNDNYFEHSRWRWNGTNLLQISPGVRQEQCFTNPKIKIPSTSEVHLCTNPESCWLPPFDPFLNWLTARGVSMDRWISKKIYHRWIVIDESDHIQRVYFELDTRRQPLFANLSAEVTKDASTTVIRLWNEHPVWPNALAAGLLLYLFLYVLMRCVATFQSKLALNPETSSAKTPAPLPNSSPLHRNRYPSL